MLVGGNGGVVWAAQFIPSNLAALDFELMLGVRNKWGDMLLDPLELMVCNYPYQGAGYHQLGHFYTGRHDLQGARDAFNIYRFGSRSATRSRDGSGSAASRASGRRFLPSHFCRRS